MHPAICKNLDFLIQKKFSKGFEGDLTKRNSMGLIHARFYKNKRFFWDERAATLEDQVLMPIQDPIEMGLTLEELVTRVSAKTFYPPLFEQAFRSETVTSERIAFALAQFIRSMDTFDSKFRQGIEQTRGNPNKVPFVNFTDQENRGKALFMDKKPGNCRSCHNKNVMIAGKARNNGLDLEYADNGVGEVTGLARHDGKFKVTSLMNIELTAPYMHDGRFATLEEVVGFYSDAIQNHRNLDKKLKKNGVAININYTKDEKADLVAFLKTLTDKTS